MHQFKACSTIIYCIGAVMAHATQTIVGPKISGSPQSVLNLLLALFV